MIVDIKKIADMSSIRERDGCFVIGAATPGAVIGECEALRQAWPGVVEAANLIGSTQIQGRATLAGNLLQRTHPASTATGTEMKPANTASATSRESVRSVDVRLAVFHPRVWTKLQTP